jgi:hypothetical protein
MRTRHQYVTTYNTGAASWGVYAEGFFKGFGKGNLEHDGGHVILPPAKDGRRIGFRGSDCVGDGRFWCEAYEAVGEAWVPVRLPTTRDAWHAWKNGEWK